MDRFQDRALVLSSLDYGEADKIVHFFTREHGRLSAFANGARKSKRRFGGKLEPATLLNVQLVARNSELYRLDGAEIVETHHQLRAELVALARAQYGLELVRELSYQHQASPELFDDLVQFLRDLTLAAAPPAVVLAFELRALERVGYMPQLTRCASCGKALPASPAFSPSHGGALCARCAPSGTACLSPAEHDALRALQSGSITSHSQEVEPRVRAAIYAFSTYYLHRELKSRSFLGQAEGLALPP